MGINEIAAMIFGYHQDSPLIFTQVFFWIFFGVVLLVYGFIYPVQGRRNAWLFLVSLFFYYKTSGLFVLLLLFSTVTDYHIGGKIHTSNSVFKRKLWLGFSIFLNLSVLIYFKYAYFFTDTYNQLFSTQHTVYNHLAQWSNSFFNTGFRAEKILLPVGISFFTFQTMSYAFDIYYKKIEPVKNMVDFGFYVTFFPQLVAGPIVRASEFVPQLYLPYNVTRIAAGFALFQILNGLVKKLFLADYIAVNFIDRVFSNPAAFSGFENLAALFGYSLQVYADFSGYTDIAIGVAALLGFTLPINFDSPYKARNVGEFWKRWHISLSTWLKDYLYVPMGGNKRGSVFSYVMLGIVLIFIVLFLRSWSAVGLLSLIVFCLIMVYRLIPDVRQHFDTNINILLTMTIGGLWHGASWNMVIWGAMNGAGLIVYKYWNRIRPQKWNARWTTRAVGIILTLCFITFTRLWFRGESLEDVSVMLRRIAYGFRADLIPQVLTGYASVFSVIIFGYIIHWLPSSWKRQYRLYFAEAHWSFQAIVTLILIIAVYQVLSADLQPFIYFIF